MKTTYLHMIKWLIKGFLIVKDSDGKYYWDTGHDEIPLTGEEAQILEAALREEGVE